MSDIPPVDWRWGKSERSREFDRMLDAQLTFREKLEWLEEAETLSLRLRENALRKTIASPIAES
jgi:hypothetical protein